jgi:predicted nucleic-acid-binding protein
MVYLDTNILVRLATFDDPAAAKDVATYIAEKPKDSLVVSEGVVVEVCFVLEFHEYKMKRADICGFLREVFSLSQVVADPKIERALALYGTHRKLDFLDCLLVVASGGSVYSLDKELMKLCKSV